LALCLTTVVVAFTGFFVVARYSNMFTTAKPFQVSNRLTFDVELSDLVAMTISDTSRYDISDDGQADYAALMPKGGHNVHISREGASKPRPYTVALFHQLKCLEIYHREYLKPPPRQVTRELQGCMNYLRQAILCHANSRLESVKNEAIQAEKRYDTVCRDWTKVYEAAERNFEDYTAWKAGKV